MSFFSKPAAAQETTAKKESDPLNAASPVVKTPNSVSRTKSPSTKSPPSESEKRTKKPIAKKRARTPSPAASAGSPHSDSSYASSSGSSSSSSDESMASGSDESPQKRAPRSPKTKKTKTRVADSPVDESDTLADVAAVDVAAMFGFGTVAATDAPLARSQFTSSRSGDSAATASSEPTLSTEDIDKLCKGVPPFVAMFTRLYYEMNTRFDFPSWYNPKSLRDKKNRVPTDPDYDVTTITIPRKNGKVVEDGHATPMLQQYWTIKEDHFNEVTLFKVGKFYEMFYMDAVIGQQVCGLKWMGNNRRAHVGFPEVSLQQHASLLVKEGYTVCVVEQTETVSEAIERQSSSGALVERKICEVFTKGTLIHEPMLGESGSSHYMCSVFCEVGNGVVGVVMTECASGTFQVCTVDSPAALKTVLYSYQPREIIFDPKNLTSESNSVLTQYRDSQAGTAVLSRWSFPSADENLPETVPDEVRAVISASHALTRAVSGSITYLTHLLLRDQVVLSSQWSVLSSKDTTCMVLDSTVLSHLEILRDSEGSEKGSLFRFLNRTATPFGARMLQKWICCPLTDVVQINARLDAVSFLSSEKSTRTKLQDKLAELPDLERKLQRICAQALQQERKAVFFSEVEHKRIGTFLQFLSSVRKACGVLEFLCQADGTSVLLLGGEDVTSFWLNEAGMMKSVCDELSSMVVSGGGNSANTFAPKRGAFADYDSVGDNIAAVEKELQAELQVVKGVVGKDAVYISVKYRNEIEIPAEKEKTLKSAGVEFEVTSCRKGFVRIHTETVKALVEKIADLEQQQKDLLYPFMSKLFSRLNENRVKLAKIIAQLAEVDCLLSLAKVGVSAVRPFVRPVFGSSSGGGVQIMLTESRHPIQEQLLGPNEFVSNDIMLDPTVAGSSVLIITGANMGGKSTILRQVCLTVILAQIGCFVPATECHISTPVDRVFTRLGASDNILENKSTFLTELEETAVMLREATSRSLLVIDELGRGTSTFDGVAIAGATLSHIAKSIKCNTLFATHYHKLCEENFGPHVGLFHMECICHPDGRIELTHKFRKGQYPHSQAMHVAKLAGVKSEILTEAEEVSKRFLENATSVASRE